MRDENDRFVTKLNRTFSFIAFKTAMKSVSKDTFTLSRISYNDQLFYL